MRARSFFVAGVVAVALAASPSIAAAESLDAGLEVDAGLFAALPTVLDSGQLLGPGAGAVWAFPSGVTFGGRLHLGFGSEASSTHQLGHAELRGLATVGYGVSIDEGRFALELGAGGAFIHETRTRHQAKRLERAGITNDTRSTSWTLGPAFELDLVLRLFVLQRWGVVLRGGPTLAWALVRDERRSRWGWAAAITIAHHFGDGGDP